MAGSRFTQAFSFLSLAASTLAAPLTSFNEANVLARAASSVPDICSAQSTCIPFTIDVAWGTANPTGAGARGAILTNGTMPGPALRMKVGECVDFLVINNLAVDTSVHFHGISQMGTPWADGTPGLAQAAIKPGKSFMYRWTADEQGAYFYHSHYKGQIMDGLYGAIFIQPADNEVGPWSMIDSSAVAQLEAADAKNEPLFVSDWTKYTFDELYAVEQNGNVDIACADAIIINGLGGQYCLPRAAITAQSAPQIAPLTGGSGYTNKACLPANTTATQGNFTRNLAAIPDDIFNVCTTSTNKNFTLSVNKADGYAAMTFINVGGFTLMKATIDNHKMIIYEYNGRWMTPQTVDQIFIGNGERVTVMVKLDQAVGDYTIRVSNNGLNQLISGFGVLSYKGSSGPAPNAFAAMTYGGINTTVLVPMVAALAAPYPPVQVGQTADKTWFFHIQREPVVQHSWQWTLQGNASYSMANDDDTPLLFKDPSTVPESDLIFKTNYGQWIDIIMQTNGPIAQPHPMHKHGNKFFVLGQGTGSFNWSTVAEAQAAIPAAFNLVNPPYVDGYTTVPGENKDTWTVFRYQVDDVGVWFLHCHMQTHLSGGMAIVMMDGVDKWPTVPADAGKVCQGSGMSNSSWTPSCSCPVTCPANPSTNSTSSTGGNAGVGTGSIVGNDTPNNNGGSWNNGTWTGSNNPANPSKDTGNTNNGTGPIQTYSGNAASASHVSLFTVLALAAAALML